MNEKIYTTDGGGTVFAKNKKRKRPMRSLFIFSMIIIPISSFALFYVYVNLSSFLMAFQIVGTGGKVRWTFDNFRFFFSEFKFEDSVLPEAIKNTLMTFGLNLITALVTSFLI